MSIPDYPDNPTEFKSLLDNHGEIDINTIRTVIKIKIQAKDLIILGFSKK